MTKDDQSWRNIVYILCGLLILYTVYHISMAIGEYTGYSEKYEIWPLAAKLFSVGFLAIIAHFFVRGAPDREYHAHVVSELRKVKWPSMPDTKRMTTVVVIVVCIFAVILTIFDLVWGKILHAILSG
jgi:preprotein translocase SecE subunit